MNALSILKALITVSEKSANIARIIRQNGHLLALLVQEKKEGEKNPRFSQDFKTFADVLVQEVVKNDLGKEFPELEGHILGEESPNFGEERVRVGESSEETKDLINKVLDDSEAARLLAEEIHRSDMEPLCSVPQLDENLKLPETLAVWIDPIDSTAEYINGEDVDPESNLCQTGLPCVTVLIGVFDLITGVPVLGVINQPFHRKPGLQWEGKIVFGMNVPERSLTGPEPFLEPDDNKVAVSLSEAVQVKEALVRAGFSLVNLAGAGYKILAVIRGQVAAYVLSKPSTFFWDTCACQAVLEATGGSLIDFTTHQPLRYEKGSGVEECCNKGGIIAARTSTISSRLISALSSLSTESQ